MCIFTLQTMQKNNRIRVLIPSLILLAYLCLGLYAIVSYSQTYDEAVHIAAGYTNLTAKDYRFNTEHPPLIKMLQAAPLAMVPNVTLSTTLDSWRYAWKWNFAEDFVYNNTVDFRIILFSGRFVTLLIGTALGFAIFFWTKKNVNYTTALIALLLYAFSPTVLAHSVLITNDIAAALFYFLGTISIIQYLRAPSTKNLLTMAFVIGIAQTVKFNLILLFPLLVLLLGIYWGFQKHERRKKVFLRLCGALIVTALVTALCILAVYRFQTLQSLPDKTNTDRFASVVQEFKDGHQLITRLLPPYFISTAVPGYAYFEGLMKLTLHNDAGHTSYLFGTTEPQSRWYYFPVVFLLKISGPVMLLILLVTLYYAKTHWRKKIVGAHGDRAKIAPITILGLVFSPLMYLLASMMGNLNIGVRHIIPIFPFLFIFIAIGAHTIAVKNNMGRYLIVVLLLAHTGVAMHTAPWFISYFNAFSGGAVNGPRYAADSNADWGQGLFELADYLQKNHITDYALAPFSSAPLQAYGLDAKELPIHETLQQDALPKYGIISTSVFFPQYEQYKWLSDYTPIAFIGDTFFVYQLQ